MQLKTLSGLSLIELIIGLFVGAIIIAGATKILSDSNNSKQLSLQGNTLNQDLRSMMDIMVRYLRRAGYASANPDSNTDGVLDDNLRNNPFAALEIEENQHCIVYMINKNANSPPAETNERLGFKLDLDTSFSPAKSVLRVRRSSLSLACSSGLWENFTSPSVEISNVTFTPHITELNVTTHNNNPGAALVKHCASGDSCLYLRHIAISLSGRLVAHPETSLTLTDSVTIRNNQFVARVP